MEGGVHVGYTLSQTVITGFAAKSIFLPFELFLQYLVCVCVCLFFFDVHIYL